MNFEQLCCDFVDEKYVEIFNLSYGIEFRKHFRLLNMLYIFVIFFLCLKLKTMLNDIENTKIIKIINH